MLGNRRSCIAAGYVDYRVRMTIAAGHTTDSACMAVAACCALSHMLVMAAGIRRATQPGEEFTAVHMAGGTAD